MDLYTRNSLACSEITTKNYSTSFSLGVRMLDKRFRSPVYAIYGYVRFADEIVDTFLEHDKDALLDAFRIQTYEAIEKGISTNPILHSFQWVVRTYGIEMELIDAFMDSMAMDLEKNTYSREEYQRYIYGSAEVVGLMCLRVFCGGKDDQYRSLLPAARKLGEAFQKVNFLRDMRADHMERGRVYFPEVDFDQFDSQVKSQIEQEIMNDFRVAFKGIQMLPADARLGVYLAYRYYLELLKKIRQAPPEELLESRLRVSNRQKVILLAKAYARNRTGWI
jgi:15-cis-phytoene synthase